MHDEILDEVEELATRMPSEDLARHLEARAHALPQGAPGRASLLCHAGERWEMVDDFVHARACYEQAVADGGETYLDPRADLVNVLLEVGETEQADRMIEDLRRDAETGQAGEFLHERVGESLELHDRHEDALAWYAAGLARAEQGNPHTLDLGCLNGRYRVRRALGLPHDRYDQLCEERRLDYADSEDECRLLGVPETGSLPLTVLYWPAAEFERALRQWPAFAETCGTDHAEHRGRVERRLRALVDHDGPVAVGRAAVEDYLCFAESRGDNAGDPSTRGMYGAHLAFLGRVVPWPPAPDAPCWCGSGTAYASCCAALGAAPA